MLELMSLMTVVHLQGWVQGLDLWTRGSNHPPRLQGLSQSIGHGLIGQLQRIFVESFIIIFIIKLY